MEYIQLTMDDYLQTKEEIKKDLGGIVKSFVRVGWHLTRINASEAYKMDGYKTISEFAKAEYGMTPSGVSRFMEVYEKYSADGDTPELQERYREFNFSQLTEMLQISEEDREMFRPEAKRESIRDFRNFTKENENNPDNLTNWMKEPQDLLGKTIMEFFRANKEILNELYGSEAYTTGNIKEMVEIVNPSGNRHYRHKTVFLMLYEYEKGIMVSEFGKSPEDMTWEQFFAITQEIFQDAAAGSRTWENYFEPEVTTEPEIPEQEPESEEQKPDDLEKEEEQEENLEEQIPGQDNVMNHPEFLPGEKTEIAPAQKPAKTEEQKYKEKQARIDRETKKKLQEREDEEKMQHLPSDDGPQTHQIRLASSYFDDVAAGIKTFELRKNDRHYRKGDVLELMEFAEGRNTGRLIRAEVTYILEDYTGLEDGYCILAIKVVEVNG